MFSSNANIESSKDNISNISKEEDTSIYSDACSNSLEITQLIKKEKEKITEKKSFYNLNETKKGNSISFNSTKSTLDIKKNCKYLKKIDIKLPKKNYYLSSNNKKLLTPIDEKLKSNDGLILPVFSAEIKKQNFFSLRQSLESKNNNFIFSPNTNNINIKNIKKSVFSSFNINIDNIKDKENNNLENININEFNYNDTKRSHYTNKNKTNNSYYNESRDNSKELRNKSKSISSFNLKPSGDYGPNLIYKNNFPINSTLSIKRILKFDKTANISDIEFKNISKDEIDLEFLKQKLRIIPSKINKKSENKHLQNLVEIQNFYVEKSPIRVIKLSKDYQNIAIGCESGSIKLYSLFDYNSSQYDFIYNKKNILNYFKFIAEKPFLHLQKHTKDIIDLSWSPFKFELLLSASLDYNVILWDISQKNGNNIIKKFNHNDIVTCLGFSPLIPNYFVTGCFDRYVRIFKIEDSIVMNQSLDEEDENNINNNKLNETKSTIIVNNFKNFNIKNKIFNNSYISNSEGKKFDMPYYFNINEIITALEFFPDGEKLAVGTHNGKILVYKIFPKISYEYNFTCRNKLGKFSSGKKITSIQFINRNSALISTSDSRIRLVSMNNGKLIHKYKGHQNLNSMIRCSPDLINDVIISGSEDNFCYIWNLYSQNKKEIKNYKYEYFKPYAKENIYCSLIVPEICFTNYIKKIYKLTNRINIISVIVNATDNGRLEVLLNAEEN